MAKSKIIIRKAVKSLLLFLLISLSATLGTLPLIVYSFNGFSTVSLIANCIAVPLMGMITLSIGMAVILSAIISPALSAFLVHIASLTLIPSLAAVKFLASFPFSYPMVTTPSVTEIAMYYLLFISLVTMISRRREAHNRQTGKRDGSLTLLKCVIVLSVAFFIADILYLSFGELFRSQLQVTAVDVGQGSSTLIRLPGGKNMLIDGGGSTTGSFDIGKYVLAPYLWQERINRLDTVVLTHPHPDHLQGLLYLLDKFTIGEVWTGGYRDGNELYDTFRNLIKEKGIPVRILAKGTAPAVINGVTISILNPSPSVLHKRTQEKVNFEETNDSSLVIRLIYGKISFLFPGDISEAIENRLLADKTDLTSDVLFVAHHGGFTSSTTPFLKMVRPRAAIISCGKDNVFHLPHDDVLKRFEALSVQVYRTDRDGAVSITTDRHEMTVHTVIAKQQRVLQPPEN